MAVCLVAAAVLFKAGSFLNIVDQYVEDFCNSLMYDDLLFVSI